MSKEMTVCEKATGDILKPRFNSPVETTNVSRAASAPSVIPLSAPYVYSIFIIAIFIIIYFIYLYSVIYTTVDPGVIVALEPLTLAQPP